MRFSLYAICLIIGCLALIWWEAMCDFADAFHVDKPYQ